VPKSPCRLLPPQQLTANHDSHCSHNNGTWIGGNDKDAKVFYNGHIISFPFDQRSNLPCKSMIAGCHYYCQFVGQITGKDAKIPTPSNFKCCYGKHADHDILSKA